MRGFYSENDPVAAHVLTSLVSEGLIAPGRVDSRSIKDVQPHDLAGVTQAHFFAGAGLWSVAARLAGWPDDKPLWTASLPCQPWSAAGKGQGADDDRDLRGEFIRLVRACRPRIIVGEQVASGSGLKSISNEDVQNMRSREALRDVCGTLFGDGEAEKFLQGMRNIEAGEAVQRARVSGRPAEEIQSVSKGSLGDAQGALFDSGCEAAGKIEEYPLRSGPIHGQDTLPDIGGPMRNDGPALRHEGASSLEQPISRPDQSSGWIHGVKRASRDPVAEHNDEFVGRAESNRGRRCSESEERGRPELVSGALGGEPAPEAGRYWLDGIKSSLEQAGYSFRACNIPACAVDAPNIRQRLWWIAVADADSRGRDGRQEASQRGAVKRTAAERADGVALEDADGGRQQGRSILGPSEGAGAYVERPHDQSGRRDGCGGFWSDHEWIVCHDGKARRAPRRSKSSIRDVADGLSGADHCRDFASIGHNSEAIDYSLLVPSFPGRINAWKLAGNAINAILAAEVLAALLDVEERLPA